MVKVLGILMLVVAVISVLAGVKVEIAAALFAGAVFFVLIEAFNRRQHGSDR